MILNENKKFCAKCGYKIISEEELIEKENKQIIEEEKKQERKSFFILLDVSSFVFEVLSLIMFFIGVVSNQPVLFFFLTEFFAIPSFIMALYICIRYYAMSKMSYMQARRYFGVVYLTALSFITIGMAFFLFMKI